MEDDAWKNFELSGKITDYLSYRNAAVDRDEQKTWQSVSDNDNVSDRGMSGYGTEHSSDRNDTKCNAHWRL